MEPLPGERVEEPGGVTDQEPARARAAGDADIAFAQAETARSQDDGDAAVEAFLAAAAAYLERDLADAALDACYRALEVAPGDLDVHFAMAELYLRRGWREHAVERLGLIEHTLRIEDDPDVRARLADLAGEYRTLDPTLERLAALGGRASHP